jgi:LysR family positive regulator for ilvC
LTKAGRRFARFAQHTVNDYQEMYQDLYSLREQRVSLSGELTLFCTVTAAHIYVPNLITTFRRRYPNTDIKLITGDASQAVPLVTDKKVDFAFAADIEAMSEQLVFQDVEDIPCSVIAPASGATFSNLLEQEPIPWQELPFVLPEAGPLAIAMRDWFTAMDIQPDVYGRVTGHEAIVSMTALGCGLSIIPDPVLELSPLKQSVRTLHSPIKPPMLKLGIIGLKKFASEPLNNAFWSVADELFTV